MRVATIIGARPQFIKAAPVTKALAAAGHIELLIHTGQHYDRRMSQVFFDELEIPAPGLNLGVGSGAHGWQTAQMLIGLEPVLTNEKPDWVLIYGDTNSTLAGALAAAKLNLPLAHVEAGLRSYNRRMPEECNRVVADHMSDALFCPTQTAVDNLAREGMTCGVRIVGDTMFDALLEFAPIAQQRSTILSRLGLAKGAYVLATVHRPSNTDETETLLNILNGLEGIGLPVVFPVHPRTRQAIDRMPDRGITANGQSRVRLVDPVGYLDMLALEADARVILTDSGGIQKEAYLLGVPCVTLRSETEWVETIDAGWNVLAGTDPPGIVAAALNARRPSRVGEPLFGKGDAAGRIVEALANWQPRTNTSMAVHA